MIKKWLSLLFIIGLTGVACGFILAGSDEATDAVQSFKAPGVAVTGLGKTDYRLQVPARGIVRAGEYADVRSEITGKITTVSSGLYAGANVKKGDLLFALDDSQYRFKLAGASASCLAAKQALLQEQGRQIVAKHQWKMLASQKKYSDKEKQLALRRPQLITCQAEFDKARALRDLCQYDLDRTRIKAPCNGVILEESVSKGMLTGPETVALRLACTDTYHIIARFSSQMTLGHARPAALVTIGNQTRQGRVKALLPGCDQQTGQKAALVEFESDTASVLNRYAGVALQGAAFSDVYVIDRDAIRPGNTVWLLDEKDCLAIAPLTLLGQDGRNVVVKGLKPNTRLILSHLSNPLSGMALNPLPAKN